MTTWTTVTAGLEYRFHRPKDEPLVWMADAVAGAVLASLTRGAKGKGYTDRLSILALRQVP